MPAAKTQIHKKKLSSAGDILRSSQWLSQRQKSEKYITREYQDFGVRLAYKLNDEGHISLYIKLAKTVEKTLLEKALSFSLDYPKAGNKAKIFMWKLKELRNLYKKAASSKTTE